MVWFAASAIHVFEPHLKWGWMVGGLNILSYIQSHPIHLPPFVPFKKKCRLLEAMFLCIMVFQNVPIVVQ